jgi:hypothetical protein
VDGDCGAECGAIRKQDGIVYMRGELKVDAWVMSHEFVGGLSI